MLAAVAGVGGAVSAFSRPTHPDPEVDAVLIRLLDTLYTWERNTGRRSALVLREHGGYVVRAVDGKPEVSADIPDENLFGIIEW